MYRTSFALAVTVATAVGTNAVGQAPAPSRAGAPTAGRPFIQAPNTAPPAPGATAAPDDSQVYRSGQALPEPVDIQEEQPAIPLPTGPIEPFLLTKQAGPFMVLAHTFKGPHALRYAQALAIEMRNKYKLPAYVFFVKLKPGNSNIQGVPPTAPRYVNQPDVTPPEADRVIDEAAVLVGNCKSIEEADELRDDIKKLKPETLGQKRSMFHWRDGKGLSRALVTTNPLIPAQDLYPGRPQATPPGLNVAGPGGIQNGAVVDPEILRSQFVPAPDPLVERMNQGPHSAYKCPAPYTLVVAEFSGRASMNEKDPIFTLPSALKESPLETAHEDAENLAALLAKHPVVKSLGVEPYVYHDRMSSKVTLGGFSSPQDPRIEQVRRGALQVEVETKREGNVRFRQYLAPASGVFQIPHP